MEVIPLIIISRKIILGSLTVFIKPALHRYISTPVLLPLGLTGKVSWITGIAPIQPGYLRARSHHSAFVQPSLSLHISLKSLVCEAGPISLLILLLDQNRPRSVLHIPCERVMKRPRRILEYEPNRVLTLQGSVASISENLPPKVSIQ